jgi:hypothetical protein
MKKLEETYGSRKWLSTIMEQGVGPGNHNWSGIGVILSRSRASAFRQDLDMLRYQISTNVGKR